MVTGKLPLLCLAQLGTIDFMQEKKIAQKLIDLRVYLGLPFLDPFIGEENMQSIYLFIYFLQLAKLNRCPDCLQKSTNISQLLEAQLTSRRRFQVCIKHTQTGRREHSMWKACKSWFSLHQIENLRSLLTATHIKSCIAKSWFLPSYLQSNLSWKISASGPVLAFCRGLKWVCFTVNCQQSPSSTGNSPSPCTGIRSLILCAQ